MADIFGGGPPGASPSACHGGCRLQVCWRDRVASLAEPRSRVAARTRRWPGAFCSARAATAIVLLIVVARSLAIVLILPGVAGGVRQPRRPPPHRKDSERPEGFGVSSNSSARDRQRGLGLTSACPRVWHGLSFRRSRRSPCSCPSPCSPHGPKIRRWTERHLGPRNLPTRSSRAHPHLAAGLLSRASRSLRGFQRGRDRRRRPV